MTRPMSAAEVLRAAADEVESWPDHYAERELRNPGGAAFTLLYEHARRLYGAPAIQAMERHLRGALPHGQLQHWSGVDRAGMAAAIRAAAANATEPRETP